MENLLVNTESTQEGIALQALVSRLVAGAVPAAVRNNSFMVNDIAPGLKLAANTDIVTAVLSNLFNTVAMHAENSCIRITAKVYGNVIVIQLRDHNSANIFTIAHGLQEVQPIAEKICGYIGVTSQRKSESTIVFSFPNLPIAA